MKNITPIFCKYAHIDIIVSSEDNSSYSPIIILDLSLLSEASSEILLQSLRKHATSLQVLST